MKKDTIKDDLELFRDLINRSNDAIFVNDPTTGRFIFVNDKACDGLGYDREELLLMGVTDIEATFPDNFSWQAHTDKLRREGSLVMEGWHRRRDGSRIPVEVNVRHVVLHHREYMVAIVRDITGLKEIEQRVRESEEFIRRILDTVDEGFIIINRDYRVITANRAYCNMVGKSDKEIVDRHCYALSHGRSRPCHEEGASCIVREVFQDGQPHGTVRRLLDGGRPLFLDMKAYPIRDASGAVNTVIETINNITERQLLEEERLRTQKLESIGTLAGGIAHDFNNLLQGIFGYISMARMFLDSKERSLAMLEQAEKAIHQSVSLTTQMLTFSKGGKPVTKRLSLRPLIDSAAKFALSGSRSTCSFEIDPGLWEVEGDRGQLEQVIQNIVMNADQAMPGGGPVVITARNAPKRLFLDRGRLPEGNYVVISVRDSGVGIPDSYLDKIFDPYFTTKEKGSGLGLATSYSIIGRHGGMIHVVSGPGEGSTFHVYLPAVSVPGEAEESLRPSLSAGSRKILVMDDEEVVRTVAGQFLTLMGHQVEFAEDGEAALRKYSEAREGGCPFDAVILDLTVRAGMGGKDALRRLLALDPGVRAVVSSGYSADDAVANYRTYGFTARLPKPYRLDDLRDVLNEALGA